MLSGLRVVADSLAAPGRPMPLFRTVDAALAETIGQRLLTLMVFDQNTYEAERVYSTNARAYPVGGRKRLRKTAWGAHVIDGRRDWLAETPAELERAFADYYIIAGLGLGSATNWVVVHDGLLLGTINVLHEAGRHGYREAEAGQPFAPYLIPAYKALIETGVRSEGPAG